MKLGIPWRRLVLHGVEVKFLEMPYSELLTVKVTGSWWTRKVVFLVAYRHCFVHFVWSQGHWMQWKSLDPLDSLGRSLKDDLAALREDLKLLGAKVT